MPIAYLDAPQGIGIDEKRKLVKAMYDALHEAYPFPDDVRIFLREWPSVSVGQDGRLDSEPARPVFMMHVPQGVNIEAKRKMLKGIHAAVAEAYRLPKFMISCMSIRSTWWHSTAGFIPTTRRASRPRRRSIPAEENGSALSRRHSCNG
jgi:hypothetical protein